MQNPPNPSQPLNARATANLGLPNLRFGDSGDAVRVLQRLLLSNGYSVKIDGVFGALTETAVKAFQNQQNINADGIVGINTWRKLT